MDLMKKSLGLVFWGFTCWTLKGLLLKKPPIVSLSALTGAPRRWRRVGLSRFCTYNDLPAGPRSSFLFNQGKK
jgi:hypothetical protein